MINICYTAASDKARLSYRRRALLLSTALVVAGISAGPTFADQLDFTADSSTAIQIPSPSRQLNVTSGSYTMSGKISNGPMMSAGVLEKIGDGTLILTNTANNYSGGTEITAGTLAGSQEQVFGPMGSSITFNGGTLEMTTGFNNSHAFHMTADGTVKIDTGAGQLNGIIDGTGKLTLKGSGTLQLNGVNTYSGGTEIDSGVTATITAASGLGDATAGTVTMAGGTLDINASAINLEHNFAFSAATTSTIAVRGSDTLTLNDTAGYISGTGGLTLNDGGTLVLAGTDTVGADSMGALYLARGNLNLTTTGTHTINVASVQVDSPSVMTIGDGVTLTVADGGTFTNGNKVYNYGTVTDDLINTGEYDNYGTENADVASNIGGNAVISNQTGGTWTGDVVTNAAEIDNGQDAGTYGTTLWTGDIEGNTGTINNNKSGQWIGTVANGTGEVSNTGQFGTSGSHLDATVVSNGGTIDNGDGTIAGKWYGGVTANAGTINNNSGSSWTGDVASNAGTISNDGTWKGSITSAGNVYSTDEIDGDVDNSGTFDAEGSVNGDVTNESAGAFTLTGALDGYSAGTPATGIDHFTNDGSFDLGGQDLTIGRLSGASTGSVTSSTAVTLTTGADASAATTYAGTVDGSIALTKVGSNSFTLSGENTYSGATTISAGTLALSGDGTITDSSGLEIANGATFDLSALTGAATTSIKLLTGDGLSSALDMQNDDAGQMLQVTGLLSGDLKAYLDLNSVDATADKLLTATLDDGAKVSLDVALVGPRAMVSNVHVLDTQQNSASLATVTSNLPTSGSILYSLNKIGNGVGGDDWVVDSSANPALGTIISDMALAQSALDTSIDQSSTSFGSGPSAEAQPGDCGIGPWLRGTGGFANATATSSALNSDGSTGLSTSSAANLTYKGMQFGSDITCFNTSGVNITVGALGGYDTGTISQNMTANAGMTSASFDQEYSAIYAKLVQGPLSGKVEVRYDGGNFTFNNDVLALSDAPLTSQRVTVSANANYAMDVDGINVVPTAGISVSHTSFSTLTLGSGPDQQTLAPDASTDVVAYVGGTLSKTFTAPDGKSSITPFVADTISNDFSADPTAVFSAGGTTQSIQSQHLGVLGETDVGVTYANMLEASGAPRQLNADIRGNFKYSDRIMGAGVTAALHLQF